MSISLKFLVTNPIAGLIIGPKGAAIAELTEVTDAKAGISPIADVYPGTNERVLLLSGPINSVDMAQSLMFEMLALNVEAKGDKSVAWSPRAAAENPGNFNDVQITGKITIPQSISGLVLGKGGANMKAMTDSTGVTILMSTRNEAVFTQERTIELSGTTEACSKFTSMLLAKMAEDLENATYTNRGTTYASPFGGMTAQVLPTSNVTNVARPVLDASNTTTITLSVPDNLAGSIIGRLGATIREIMSLSGANVIVEPRAAGAGPDAPRNVTITGTAIGAQTAQIMIQQKMQQPPPPNARIPRK